MKQVWLLAQAFIAASEDKERFTIDRCERFNLTSDDVVIATGGTARASIPTSLPRRTSFSKLPPRALPKVKSRR